MSMTTLMELCMLSNELNACDVSVIRNSSIWDFLRVSP